MRTKRIIKGDFVMNKQTLEKIYKMSEAELKTYVANELQKTHDNVISEDGFVYAKGTIPVLLVAHLDTVHKELVKNIVYSDDGNKISSPEGIGGDDHNGVAMILEIVKELNCSVVFCEQEEIGMVGAGKFTRSDYADDVNVNYIVELDRKGVNDAVFYSCDNKEFTDFVCDVTGFKTAFGSFSDISTLAPALKTAAVNLSCGYYNAHTVQEYVLYDEMIDIIEAVKVLIKTESEHFEYVKRAYSSYGYYGSGHYDSYSTYGHQYDLLEYDRFTARVKKDLKVEVEVIYNDADGVENVGYGSGSTKAEAWLDFFLGYDDVSANMIVDYSFT